MYVNKRKIDIYASIGNPVGKQMKSNQIAGTGNVLIYYIGSTGVWGIGT